jgi:small subunit ribosomal protein S1
VEPLEPDQIVETTVTRLEHYGAWIDCAGRTGLVLIPEISWTRISHPAQALAVDQRVRVKVLNVQSDGKFTASIRGVHPEQDPWYDPSLFAPGTEFVGRVVLVPAYGAFVELRPEVWGLLRKGKWTRQVAVGDQLRVRIETVDETARKIEVSQLAEDATSAAGLP